MKLVLTASVAAMVAATAPLCAQTAPATSSQSTTGASGTTSASPSPSGNSTATSPGNANTGSSSSSALPESMQIQQNTTAAFQRNTQLRNNPSSEAPGGSSSPVESNRLDPSAPSGHRLQIDDSATNSARLNPDAPPSSGGQSYNMILRGAPSNNGVSTGETGSGTMTSPTIGTPAPRSSAGASSPTTSTPSAAGTSSGAASGGSSGGGGGSH